MLRTTALVFSVSLLASAAHAQVDREPFVVRVPTLGADLHDPAAAAAFYQRLAAAAKLACDSGAPGDLGATLSDHRCARESLLAAVKSVNAPMLSELAGLPTKTSLALNTR
jgi:UrcA family protein